jgi:hypothetical protein
MKKIILLGFLYFPLSGFAQKDYFFITGRTFIEEYIVPNQTTKSPLSAGTYIQIKEMPERGCCPVFIIIEEKTPAKV